MRKEDKGTVIGQLTETLKEYPNFYLTDIEALDAEKTSKLRRECFKREVKLVVVKNNLLKKALENIEGDFSDLNVALKGNTAVMFSQVANAPALVNIKSNNELIADVIALLESPAKNVISALQSSGQTIHGLLKTLEER